MLPRSYLRLPSRTSLRRGRLLPLQNRPRPRARVTPAIEHDSSVNDHKLKASRVLVRFLERGVVDHARGVENRNIGHHAGPQNAAVEDADLRRIGRSHLATGLFNSQYFILVHLPPHYPLT